MWCLWPYYQYQEYHQKNWIGNSFDNNAVFLFDFVFRALNNPLKELGFFPQGFFTQLLIAQTIIWTNNILETVKAQDDKLSFQNDNHPSKVLKKQPFGAAKI